MNTLDERAKVPESYLEHKLSFDEPWIEKWVLPNPFVAVLAGVVRECGGSLADFTFNRDAANLGDTHLSIALRQLNAEVRIGLDSATFVAANPYWQKADELSLRFDQISAHIAKVVGCSPSSQETTLAFHVTPGSLDFASATGAFVNKDVVGACDFYGISLHRKDRSVVIDKSLRYDGAAFIRLRRIFSGSVTFADVASVLYEDEVAALRLLGIPEIP